MDAQIFIGKVHIIEWLRLRDRRTGRELFDEVQPMGIMSNPRVDVAFHSIETRVEFVALLRVIEDDFRATGRLPLLHIETHGNDEGIGVSDVEGFTFFELMEELIPLNGLTGLRLLVVMAACEGIWAVKMIQPATRAAALAVIGPNREMGEDEIARALQAFYCNMFADRNGDRAIQAMNDAVDPARMTFGAFNAELLFKKVYREFLEQMCAEPALSRRLDAMMVEWQERARAERGRELSPEELARARAIARQGIEAHDEHFDAFRREFFWIDRFPENDRRFPVTLEDCRAPDA